MRIISAVLLVTLCFAADAFPEETAKKEETSKEIKLPAPHYKGALSVEEAIYKRKTARSFSNKPLTLAEVSQLLWVANGTIPKDAVTGATSKVTPSAGGLYPLEAFLVAGKNGVDGLPAGVYQYRPRNNGLKVLAKGDKRNAMVAAALYQGFLGAAPATIVIGAVFDRTTVKYGGRGFQYVFMEAGGSIQNVCLQAESLGLRVATVGAFQDDPLSKALNLPDSVRPIVIMGIGH